MAKNPETEEFDDDDLHATELNEVEIDRYKKLAVRKKLPNLEMT